jgi:glycosyl hydrolase family 42 (putative beta-galactosidase)
VRRLFLVAVLCAAALVLAGAAGASPYIRYGVQDDAWLQYGPGTVPDRVDDLQSLGVDVVRYTVDWSKVEPRKGVYDWTLVDQTLNGLHKGGIAPLVTLYGAPRWANGDRTENWAPTSKWTFASFARTVAERYPFVHLWTIWNEPNQVRSLRPTSPAVYVRQLLNPAYLAIHAVSPSSQVAGGVTAPRAATGGVSPVAWIAGMKAAHAKLDAYAHNPYPLSPTETPTTGACKYCATITMASLNRLLVDVKSAFGTKTRIWLTEYGYQTNPPDRILGVTYAKQAAYLSQAALKSYLAERVDILIQYLVVDEPNVGRWQSGLYTATAKAKPALQAFRFPLTELSRAGRRTTLWGQVRPGGTQTYKLQRFTAGRWVAVGASSHTTARGFFRRVVNATAGARFRIWVPSEHTYSAIVTVA